MNAFEQRAELLIQQSRFDMAEQEIRKELAERPDNAMARALLAIALSGQKKNEPALEEARLAVGQAPAWSYVHFVLAQVQFGMNRNKEAEHAAREAIRLDPDEAEYHGLMALIKLENYEWQAALDAAERGLELDAENSMCANARAIALVKLKRTAEAGRGIVSALERDPENATTHANFGWTLLNEGDYKKALHHFREALRLEPGHEWARDGVVEALKARNPVYRLILRYFLWMARMKPGRQWAIVIGAFIGYRVVRSLQSSVEGLDLILTPLIVLYLLFVYLTWVAQPLFDLLLYLDPFGRHALSKRQKQAANIVGALLVGAIFCGALALVADFTLLYLAAGACLIMVIPVAGIFKAGSAKGRLILSAYTIGLALTAVLALAAIAGQDEIANTLLTVFVVGILIYQFLANMFIHDRGN